MVIVEITMNFISVYLPRVSIALVRTMERNVSSSIASTIIKSAAPSLLPDNFVAYNETYLVYL